MSEQMTAVITANRERQAQAKSLNIRAGEKLFAILSREEILGWVSERVAGARCIREIPNPELLRLPAFDQSLIEKVVRENPDSIEVLGRRLAVEYRDGYQPKVTLKLDSADDRSWRELPDSGIVLPGGRTIELNISFGWYDSASGSDIPKLKVQMRERLNQKQWESWQKPVVALPDLASADVVIPNIITAQYGTCVVEGTPLHAYGVSAVKDYRYYSSDPWFEGKWYQNQSEAEASHAIAVRKLEEIRVQVRNEQELAKAKTEAEAAREMLRGLTSRDGWYDLEHSLRSEVENRRYSYLPSSIEELRKDKTETEALVAKVEVAFTEFARRKEAEAAEQARAAERRGAITEAIAQFGWPEFHILVTEDGNVYLNCGKSSKMGRFEVMPSLGERTYLEASIDDRGKYSYWEPIPVNQTIVCRDYSAAGNIKAESSFVVPSGLPSGVMGIGQDDRGKFFFPVIYYRNGREIVPEEVVAHRAEAKLVSPAVQTSVNGNKFTDVGNRWFKCSSGHTMRVDKADWSRYQQGEALALTCSICGSSGSAHIG